MNGYNFSDASDIKLGGSTITALYYGSTLLWPLERDYSKEYLTIEAISDSTVIFYKNNDNISRSIQYSKDKNTWNTISFVHPSGDITEASPVSLLAGEKLYLKGSNSSYCTGGGANYCRINILEGSGNIYGNIMSLIYGDNFYGQTSLNTDYTFRDLFSTYEHNNIIDASNLILPATTLSTFCYCDLFLYCDQLTVAPELPATTLTNNCYRGMFRGCTSLTTAPELPATTLAKACYNGMFGGCTSLTTAPELPATTLPETSSSADTDDGCYGHMFSGCTSLTTAPELQATTLTSWCYCSMFNDCTSLTIAPELPATTLAYGCYWYMFDGCTSLTTAPELPATTLTSNCYNRMFRGCTSLTTAPELPATTLVIDCYNEMFKNCTSLNYIKCLATDISAYTCLDNWVNSVASTGTFVKNPNMTSWPTGDSGIPSGWTVQDAQDHDYSQDYLTFEALEAGTFTWTDTQNSNSILYSTDNGSTWSTLASGSSTPTIAANSKVLFKASGLSVGTNGIGTFSSTGTFNAMGNTMSLVYGDNFANQTIINSYQFYQLFKNSRIVDASNLILPATTLAESCYRSMFGSCASLITVPELPATTLTESCYRQMFTDCTSLTTSPELPATTLANNCYRNMFTRCSSLVTVSELPATTLDVESYRGMFISCTSLTTAPELPATTLTTNCYYYMFNGCTNLNYIKMLATDISASGCLNGWVTNVASTGTFVKNANMSSLPIGVNGIPSGWTVQNAS